MPPRTDDHAARAGQEQQRHDARLRQRHVVAKGSTLHVLSAQRRRRRARPLRQTRVRRVRHASVRLDSRARPRQTRAARRARARAGDDARTTQQARARATAAVPAPRARDAARRRPSRRSRPRAATRLRLPSAVSRSATPGVAVDLMRALLRAGRGRPSTKAGRNGNRYAVRSSPRPVDQRDAQPLRRSLRDAERTPDAAPGATVARRQPVPAPRAGEAPPSCRATDCGPACQHADRG